MTENTLLEDIKNISNEYENQKKRLISDMKEKFIEISKKLFEEYPKLNSFSWTQYAPYFNDGDICEFSVNTWYDCIKINDEYEYEYEDEDEDKDEQKNIENNLTHSEVIEISKIIQKFLESFSQDMFESVFGNDSEVTIKRDGTITVEVYTNHD